MDNKYWVKVHEYIHNRKVTPTLECPKCGQLIVGDEPRIVTECNNCKEVKDK